MGANPAAPPIEPNRRRRRLAIGAGAVVLALAAAIVLPLWLLRPAGGRTDAASSDAGQVQDFGAAPAYRLTDQHGRAVDSHQFAGKVQVVSYLFPYCTTYCPMIARNLVELRQRLLTQGLGDRVQLVAFNVDPAGAGPAQMRAFWAEFGGNPNDSGFTFLTGTPAQIRTVVTDGFHVSYQKVSGAEETDGSPGASPPPPNPLAERAHVNYDVQHNDFVEIVDTRGHIRQVFDSGSQAGPDELARAVRAALG